MGQTLTNGIFLPNEGERNCYEGLAGNWRTLDYLNGGYNVHVADAVIHVSQADRDKWDAVENKADASALTAHTGDTTIHVTAADKQTWDTVTNKANDADAVHKSGAETIGGLKTFTDLMSIDGDYLGTEASTNQRTNLQLRSNRDTAGKSAAFITRFRQNRAQGALQPLDLQKIGFDVLENEVRTNNVFDIQCTDWLNDVPQRVNFVSSAQSYSYGRSSNKALINDLSPGALSLPDLTAGVDISGYLTNAGTTTPSEYTPTVDGWLVLAISADSPAFIRVFSTAGIDTTAYSERNELGSTSGGTYTRYAALTVPCRQNDKQNIIIMPSTMGIVKAMFYPCAGNV